MKRLAIILFLVLVSLWSFGQPKIKRAMAFYAESIPGMAMLDEKGNVIPPKPQIERYLLVDVAGTKKPDIRTVKYNGIAYTVTAIHEPGQKDLSQVPYKKSAGTTSWKVDLTIENANKEAPGKSTNIAIAGRFNGRVYSIRLYNEISINTPDRY